jgi:TPR repeat protein
MPRDAMDRIGKGDVAGSIAVLRESAEAGDAVSMFWLGRSLEEVQGVPHDYAEAMRWYHKAAEGEVGVAAWSAGRLYEMGRGTPVDSGEARKWYEEAAGLGFRRTALTVVKLRWFPGSGELEYEGVPDSLRTPPPPLSPEMAFLSRPAPDVTPEELATLRQAGLRGRLVWQGGEPGLFGLPARVILIAQKRVTGEVRQRLPLAGSLIYVQYDDEWKSYGDGKAAERYVRIHPQSPEAPWITSVTVEMEDGGSMSSSGWGWERP